MSDAVRRDRDRPRRLALICRGTVVLSRRATRTSRGWTVDAPRARSFRGLLLISILVGGCMPPAASTPPASASATASAAPSAVAVASAEPSAPPTVEPTVEPSAAPTEEPVVTPKPIDPVVPQRDRRHHLGPGVRRRPDELLPVRRTGPRLAGRPATDRLRAPARQADVDVTTRAATTADDAVAPAAAQPDHVCAMGEDCWWFFPHLDPISRPRFEPL